MADRPQVYGESPDSEAPKTNHWVFAVAKPAPAAAPPIRRPLVEIQAHYINNDPNNDVEYTILCCSTDKSVSPEYFRTKKPYSARLMFAEATGGQILKHLPIPHNPKKKKGAKKPNG